MSTDVEAGAEGAGANQDLEAMRKQILGETNRKLSATDQKLDAINQAIENLTRQNENYYNQHQPQNQAQEEAPDFWDDPQKAVQKMIDAKAEVYSEQQQQAIKQQQENAKYLKKLETLYPELKDTNSELYQKVEQNLATLPDHDKSNKFALREVVEDTALEMNIVPSSRRKERKEAHEQKDTFMLGSDDGSGGSRTPRNDGNAEISDKERQVAALLGLNVNDPKVMQQLANKKRETNSDWRKYKPLGDGDL